jgi:hypothetical protein
MYNSVCVKECPKNIQPIGYETVTTERLECMVNNDETACPRPNYNSTVIFTFCTPEVSSTVKTINIIAEKLNSNKTIANTLNDFSKAWGVLVYMSFVSFVLTLIYVYLLQHIAKPLLYTSIVLIVLGLLGGAGYCSYAITLQEAASDARYAFFTAAIVLWLLFLIVAIFLCCNWTHIALGASILQASSDFLSSNQRIIVMPIVKYFEMLPSVLIWSVIILYMLSNGTPVYKENSYVAMMVYDETVYYLFFFMLFGLFWFLAFLDGIQKVVVALTTCMWYFSGQGSDEAEAVGNVSVM